MIFALKEVSKNYTTSKGTVRAVSDLTFDIKPGERVALIGPSGSGKTTLFRVLNATLRPTSGTLRFNERNVSEMSGRELRAMRRQIGTIYQQHFLVPSLTALENALCGRLGHWSLLHTIRSLVRPARRDTEQAMAALESVGLADKRNARADELSGGQQQRLAIARVLMQEPDVILADEPFASLDPALTETIISLLIGITQNGKRALVVTLHDVEMALRAFPRLVALKQGRLAFDVSSAEVTRAELAALYREEAAKQAGSNESERLSGLDRSESFCETGWPH